MPTVVIERAFPPGDPWDSRALGLQLPADRCPCCGGPTTKTARLSSKRDRGVVVELVWIDVPVCARSWQPAWLRIIGLVATVLLFVPGFSLVAVSIDLAYSVEPPGLGALVAPLLLTLGLATVALWAARRYFRVRFARYDGHRLVFRVADPEYARQLAELNDGQLR